MRRILKHIRIGWTFLCGTVVLLTLLFWGRSYFREDSFTLKPDWGLVKISSAHGLVWYNQSRPTSKFGVRKLEKLVQETHASDGDEFHNVEIVNSNQTWYWLKNPRRWFLKFGFEQITPGQFLLIIPYWLPVLVGSALGAIPWIHWSRRFSLRTLLVITTIAAFALMAFVLSH